MDSEAGKYKALRPSSKSDLRKIRVSPAACLGYELGQAERSNPRLRGLLLVDVGTAEPRRFLTAGLALALVAFFGAGAGSPQSAPPTAAPAEQQPSGPVIRREVDLVLVEAVVRDSAGRPMKGLKQDEFFLYEEGVQQEIAHFSQDQLPLAVALVVDQSGSIKPFLRPLQYASLTALRTLKPEDQVALFVFSNET